MFFLPKGESECQQYYTYERQRQERVSYDVQNPGQNCPPKKKKKENSCKQSTPTERKVAKSNLFLSPKTQLTVHFFPTKTHQFQNFNSLSLSLTQLQFWMRREQKNNPINQEKTWLFYLFQKTPNQYPFNFINPQQNLSFSPSTLIKKKKKKLKIQVSNKILPPERKSKKDNSLLVQSSQILFPISSKIHLLIYPLFFFSLLVTIPISQAYKKEGKKNWKKRRRNPRRIFEVRFLWQKPKM